MKTNPPMPQVPPSLQPGTPLVTPLFLVSPFQFLDTLLAVHFHSSHHPSRFPLHFTRPRSHQRISVSGMS